MSYMHKGFWQCMDTKREMDMLEKYLSNRNSSLEEMGTNQEG